MTTMRLIFLIVALYILLAPGSISAQEFEGPLPHRSGLNHPKIKKQQAKPTSLSLPFFEDFTNPEPFPRQDLWMDRQVFVNNTMASGLKSRGCATFDGYDEFGIPYDSMNPGRQFYADSLTSRPINLSSFSPSDSLYLSFHYQAKGWGYAPKHGDSLLLFMLQKNGKWRRVWSASETDYSDFAVAMVPVTDTAFFSDQFQFRFVNKATVGISNSNWNVDYIILDQSRNNHDSLMSDVAFTKNPTNLLSDFTAMPFRHFKTNPSAFLRSTTEAYLRNNGNSSQQLNYGASTQELISSTFVSTKTGDRNFGPNEENNITFTTPEIGSFPEPATNSKLIFENKYFVASAYPGESKENDTIVQHQIFDNYFAYDDGSAEQAYFLNLFPNAPGMIALEYALYQPDTLRGIAIYLPRQVPSGSFKEFSLAVYKDIAIDGKTDDLIHQESYLYPNYTDTANQFTIYAFEQPVPLPEGIFYIALIQSAGGTSDSLYIGLDKNRSGANHRYYNVEGTWESSLIDGALMMRPIVGQPLPPTSIDEHSKEKASWSVFPNPSMDRIFVRATSEQPASYRLFDVQGKILAEKYIQGSGFFNLTPLAPGIYFIERSDSQGMKSHRKFIKK